MLVHVYYYKCNFFPRYFNDKMIYMYMYDECTCYVQCSYFNPFTMATEDQLSDREGARVLPACVNGIGLEVRLCTFVASKCSPAVFKLTDELENETEGPRSTQVEEENAPNPPSYESLDIDEEATPPPPYHPSFARAASRLFGG